MYLFRRKIFFTKNKFFFLLFSIKFFYDGAAFSFCYTNLLSSDLNHSIATNIVRQIFLHSGSRPQFTSLLMESEVLWGISIF